MGPAGEVSEVLAKSPGRDPGHQHHGNGEEDSDQVVQDHQAHPGLQHQGSVECNDDQGVPDDPPQDNIRITSQA